MCLWHSGALHFLQNLHYFSLFVCIRRKLRLWEDPARRRGLWGALDLRSVQGKSGFQDSKTFGFSSNMRLKWPTEDRSDS